MSIYNSFVYFFSTITSPRIIAKKLVQVKKKKKEPGAIPNSFLLTDVVVQENRTTTIYLITIHLLLKKAGRNTPTRKLYLNRQKKA